MFDITIVGGGFCGTMTAVQLMRTAQTPLHIRLVEKAPWQLARGIAYSTVEHSHLLNVPAGRMSAFPEDPDHFLRWAQTHSNRIGAHDPGHAITPESFLPRKRYGDYLAHLLDDAISNPGMHTLEVITDQVTRLEAPRQNAVDVQTRNGARWRSDACVLALGNTTPETPPAWAASTLPNQRYHNNPWATDVVPRLLESRSCLLLGSGLTMLDIVMALDDHKYQGTIHVVSRRGLVPLAHVPAGTRKSAEPPIAASRQQPSVRELFAQLRHLAAHNDGSHADWQAAVDAMRPHSQQLWQRLSHADQRRFLRHARSYWDHHRHRVAPVIRQRFDDMVASGRVQLHVGRAERIALQAWPKPAIGALISGRANAEALYADQLVNCTGPGAIERGCNGPLLQALLREYPLAGDKVGLGIAVEPDMRICSQGSARIFALGPPTKGHLWESTAIPECRVAVRQVVAALTEELEYRPKRPSSPTRLEHIG